MSIFSEDNPTENQSLGGNFSDNGTPSTTDAYALEQAIDVLENQLQAASTEASTAKTAAEAAQAAAETAQANAETAETNAETAQAAAESAKDDAETALANIGNSETNAANSATSAANSASAAATSATAAATSESNAATSESNAATSESNAATSETNAATSENNASTSATNAATSESNAASSASAASTSASAASSSAIAAGTAQTAAETAQTAAETAQSAAESAQASTESLFDQFGDQYLGSKASDPSTDNDGDALNAGDIYWNTTDSVLKFYDGSSWVAPETLAENSATAAAASEAAAATSESNAAASESAASTSESNAATSATSAASSASTATAQAANASTSASNAAASETAAETAKTNAETAQAAAELAQAAAETAETNAETAEANAATSETNAATSESNAATSASNASTSATNAATSASNAATSESNAASSESAASTSATNAAFSATAAAASESAAAISESNAATSESNAATSESNAFNSASNAAASATAAASSESNAATSETNAATSETNASNSASAAATLATNAANSATAAASSATNASSSESNALTSENNAATSETNAATSESNAATSESNAASSATAAAASASAAATSETNAESVKTTLYSIYLGLASSDPTQDLNGNALSGGEFYYNTTTSITRIYNGTSWVNGAVDTSSFVLTDSDASLDSLQFIGGTGTQGTLSWNTDEDTLDLIEGAATLQIGQEIHYHVRNNTGSTILNGTPVMVTGTLGASGRLTVAPMDGTDITYARYFIGLATEDISDGNDGKVTSFGKVRGIDTSSLGYTQGEVLWISTTNVGQLTDTEPTTGMKLPVAFCVYEGNNGTVFVRANNGHALHESHDVYINSATDGQLLTWDNTNSRWINADAPISLPDQTSQSGNFLTTNGTAASWAGITESDITDFGTYLPTSGGTITNNLTISGNLTVQGTTTTIEATNLAIADNMIYLRDGETTGNVDLGFAGNYNDGTYAHAGFFRDATDGRWKVYDGYTPEPDAAADINTGHASFSLADIQADTFYGSLSGNASTASTADKWDTARTITLGGDLSGNVSIDGTSNVTLNATIAANSVALGTDTTGNYAAGVSGGSGITVSGTAGEGTTFTVAHADTSSQASVNNSGTTYIQDITLDTFGHITGIGSATLPTYDNYSSWTISDGTNSEAISSGNTLTVTGSGATTASYNTTTNTLTISSTDNNTVYTHPTHPGDDFSVDTGPLTGATVVSDIDINVTTDTLGHVTDANGVVSTRTLTAADIGAITGNQTITLSGDVTGSGTTSIVTTVANDSHTHAFNNLTSKTSGTGDYATSGDLVSGKGSGGVALTVNDGYGNANVTWNHQDGVPEQNGNAMRIEGNTDSTSGATLYFEGKSNVTGGTAVGLEDWFTMSSSGATCLGNTVWHAGNDGSGSGLDADTVDGIQASSFLRSDAADTATGQIEISTGTSMPLKLTTSSSGPWALELYRSDTGFSSKVFNDGSSWYFQHNPSIAGSTNWHSGNDGSGSGLDADLLDGYHASTTRNSANTIPIRDANGYLQLGWINTTSGSTTNTITKIYASNDDYIRYVTPDTLKSQLGLSNASWIDAATGNYGTVKVDDDRGVSWAGYAIRDDWVFMSDGASHCGIYNDTDNEWSLHATQNGETILYYNGVHQLSAQNGYGYAPNQMRSPIFYDSNNTAYYGDFASTSVLNNLQTWGDTYLGLGTLTADSQNDVVCFSSNGSTAQSGGYSNKLKLFGGGGQSRDLQLYQDYNGYAWIDSSWNGNSFNVSSQFTMANFYQPINAEGVVNHSGAGAIYARNHAYDTVELRGYGSEMMIGSQSTAIHINYRTCNGGTANHTPTTWYWRAGSSSSWSNHHFGAVTSNGNLTSTTGMYAPIYYDSNDTAYYGDFASRSRLNSLSLTNTGADQLKSENQYLNIMYNNTGAGGVRLYDSESVLQGYWYGGGTGEHGFLDNDGSWAVRVRTSTNPMILYCNGNDEFYVYTTYTYSPGSSRAPIFYDANNTSYYTNQAGTGTCFRGAGTIYVNGDVVAYYSDERLKDIECNIPNALDKVKSLNGFYYRGNETAAKYNYDTEKRQVGVSAQEVEAILPELITDAGIGDGYKTLNYAKLVPVLIEAIKELSETVESQQEQINLLINSLKEK